MFGALANASRRQILLVLHYRGGEMTAGDIAGRFGCSWPTTSRHLKVLTEAGLVAVSRNGRERVYTLDTDRITAVAEHWIRLFDRDD